MKKIFYSLLIMAMAGFTLTSCEDVPSPFDFPTKGGDTPGTTVDPAGSGTQADPYNVAAAIEFTKKLEMGEESTTGIYIKGKIVSIREEYSAQYGNATFSISDDGTARNQFLVYHALYLGNKKWTKGSTQISEGDEVIIYGIVTNYNGTLETQQNKAYLYSLNGVTEGGEPAPSGEAKGTGTLEDPFNAVAANNEASKLAADTESEKEYYIKGKIAKIANNGEFSASYGNASFYISDDGKDANTFYVFRTLYLGNKKWTDGDTQIKVGDEVIICGKLINYKGNTPETVGNKSYIYSLNSTGGGDNPPPTDGGTLANPWTPAQANTYVSGLAGDTETTQDFYIKGKIAKIANNGEFNAQYGNATFYISADGQDNNTFYVFRTLYLGNKKWVEGDTQIKVGDEVIICGKLVNYRGNTPETVASKSYIYSLNGKSEGGGGGDQPTPTDGGTLANPWTPAQAEAYASSLSADVESSQDYYIKGKIAKIANNGTFNAQYGNASFYISSDGKDENTFYVFRTLYLGNRKWVDGDTQIKEGDEVIICGKLVNYKGNTPETVANKSYIYSLNGKTEDGGSQGGGDDGSTGSYSNPYTVAAAQAAGSGQNVYVKAYIVGSVDGQVYASGAVFGTNGTQKTNIMIAASASETDPEKCMPVQLPNTDIRAKLNLADNPDNYKKEVLLYGNIEKYFGVVGIKSVTYAEIGGNAIGTKASAKRKARR